MRVEHPSCHPSHGPSLLPPQVLGVPPYAKIIEEPPELPIEAVALFSIAGCASHDPFRKSEGTVIMHRQSGQWPSARNAGHLGDVRYPRGCA